MEFEIVENIPGKIDRLYVTPSFSIWYQDGVYYLVYHGRFNGFLIAEKIKKEKANIWRGTIKYLLTRNVRTDGRHILEIEGESKVVRYKASLFDKKLYYYREIDIKEMIWDLAYNAERASTYASFPYYVITPKAEYGVSSEYGGNTLINVPISRNIPYADLLVGENILLLYPENSSLIITRRREYLIHVSPYKQEIPPEIIDFVWEIEMPEYGAFYAPLPKAKIADVLERIEYIRTHFF